MIAPTETGQRPELRDYLAAERTFLAWLRTGLALMGFGFVVARFGLFLQQFVALQHQIPAQPYGLSLWFGTGLIAAGVVVNLWSAWHHARLTRSLAQGAPPPTRPSTQAIAVAVFLALVGLAMMIYLVSFRRAEVGSVAPTFPDRDIEGRPEGRLDKEESSMTMNAEDGIVNTPSRHSVDQTVEKIKALLQAKGVNLFALIDHSGEAAKVGMAMRPTKLVIFGNPKAGTPLMLASPSSAIDLPLKMLVWEDDQSKVWISYNSPQYLQKRHGLPQDLMQNLAVVELLAAKAAE